MESAKVEEVYQNTACLSTMRYEKYKESKGVKIGNYPIRRKISHSRPTLEEGSSLKGCFTVSGFVHSAT